LSPGATATLTANVSGVAASALAWSATGGRMLAGANGTLHGTFVAGTTPGKYVVQLTQSGQTLTSASVTIAAPAAPSQPAPAAATPRLFSGPGAAWLYSPPSGSSINISSMTGGIAFSLNAHDGGFDYPVVYTRGTHGCTTFTDALIYANKDQLCVPNPADGFHPSYGGWGADDGHLIVVDTATGEYYDFWKLYAGPDGRPNSTNVGAIVVGNLASSNGTPGTTAADITGLAGDIMPGELNCVTCLNHALNVIVPYAMNSPQIGHQAPAQHTDGTVPGAIFREGAKIRFDPAIDVNSLHASIAVKAMMRALQLYGGVITDQTSGRGIAFYSALGSDPDLTGISQIGNHLLLYY
jgi:hypothetical protein